MIRNFLLFLSWIEELCLLFINLMPVCEEVIVVDSYKFVNKYAFRDIIPDISDKFQQ